MRHKLWVDETKPKKEKITNIEITCDSKYTVNIPGTGNFVLTHAQANELYDALAEAVDSW